MDKPFHVQDALTHGTLVEVHLAIWASNRVIFSRADQLSILLLAPELMALILPIGAKQKQKQKQKDVPMTV
jgi:hypothetical protein